MVQKQSKTALECLITVKQPILPYISDIDSLLFQKIKFLHDRNDSCWNQRRPKQNNKAMPDHQRILGELGKSENCFRSVLEQTRCVLEYSEQLF